MACKWWKCDLQIATPAWNFEMPAGKTYDLSGEVGRRMFAERYISELVSRGVEVVVLADHNTGDWIDLMVEEGQKQGVCVFPGCEITTGSGADGVHLVIIGNHGKSSRDFDVLLGGVLGFTEPNYPRFHQQGKVSIPGSSGKTIGNILDSLPDDYLVIAPHALSENGIASRHTAQGDIRWRALHHPRLVAVDPGESDGGAEDSFNARFRTRKLSDFPRLRDIAFIATSDAYSLDSLGSRFSWIRMETPTLEGLRQAFLDHDARIICSWDTRLRDYLGENPNNVRHSWISSLTLGGELGNSSNSLSIEFHPALNVIIGGRGSGKSTVVAAIRQLYSGTKTLPESVRAEAESFSEAIFGGASIVAQHKIQNSQEEQKSFWTQRDGKTTETGDGEIVPTTFAVRVVNQKELFERVSRDRHDPLAASRSFLLFLDEGLGLLKSPSPKSDSWWRRYIDGAELWSQKTAELLRIKRDVAELPVVRAKIKEIEAQVAALDSPEARIRRQHNDARIREKSFINERAELLKEFIEDLQASLAREPSQTVLENPDERLSPLLDSLAEIDTVLVKSVADAISKAESDISKWRKKTNDSEWYRLVCESEADNRRYLEELEQKGIDPNAYRSLKELLLTQQSTERTLSIQEGKLSSAEDEQLNSWQELERLLDERRNTRQLLLDQVSDRSGRLRFKLVPYSDVFGWADSVRELLNIRSDAFIDDVPQLANWLWGEQAQRVVRWAEWRFCLANGDFSAISGRDKGITRTDWQKRLEKLDPAIRLRLASEVADDTVEITFLRDGGDPRNKDDWQDITQGSPGQRTAAMLGFVLHHGDEPLVLDQPEDDLDTEWISELVVAELRASRWKRQLIVVTHNANIPVNGDAERVVVLENKDGAIRVRRSSDAASHVLHCGAIEVPQVRSDIQNIMEGGIRAFVQRERKYGYDSRLSSISKSLP